MREQAEEERRRKRFALDRELFI